jgi:acyl-CoA reductase-like NAD-dependent aldehyde dehydrogenase
MNSGQTCIAPDYVLIHASKEQEFLRYASSGMRSFSIIIMFWIKAVMAKLLAQSHYQRLKAASG